MIYIFGGKAFLDFVSQSMVNYTMVVYTKH